MVEVYTHRKFDSQNGHFEPESSFTGIKFQELEGECIHRESLIPKTALLSQKEALRESNFKKIPKATELLKCFCRSLVAMPVQLGKAN